MTRDPMETDSLTATKAKPWSSVTWQQECRQARTNVYKAMLRWRRLRSENVAIQGVQMTQFTRGGDKHKKAEIYARGVPVFRARGGSPRHLNLRP